MDDSAILELVPMILRLPDGFDVALNMVWLRIIQDQREKKDLSPEVKAAGRLVVEACQFDHRMNREAHELQEMIEACLGSPEGVSSVERLLDRLKLSHSMYGLGFMEENRIFGALLAAQPLTVLNRLFGDGNLEDDGGMRGFFDHDELIGSPLDHVPQVTLLAWCDEDSAVRYPLIAARLCPFNKSHHSDVRQWKELALALLEHAPDKIEVLKHYIDQFHPRSYSGSRSAAWEANAKLLDVFVNDADVNLAEFARVEREKLRQCWTTSGGRNWRLRGARTNGLNKVSKFV